jgi:hypothetical protein
MTPSGEPMTHSARKSTLTAAGLDPAGSVSAVPSKKPSVRHFDRPSPARSRGRVLRTSVVAFALLVGCGMQRTPDKYTGSVKKNFLSACQVQSKQGNVSDPKKVCTCSYNDIVATIKFSDFKKINSDLSKNPGPLPPELAKIVENCQRSSETSATNPTTTGAAGAKATTTSR